MATTSEQTSSSAIAAFVKIATYPQNDTTQAPFDQYINVKIIRRYYTDPATQKTVVEVEPLGYANLSSVAPTYYVNETLNTFATRVAQMSATNASQPATTTA